MERIDIKTATRIVRWASAIGLAVAAVFLLVMAIIVRYFDYMKAKPRKFMIELLVVSIGTSLPIFYLAHTRRSSFKRATRDFVLITVYGALLWVLCEVAGVNSTLFPEKPRAVPFFDLLN